MYVDKPNAGPWTHASYRSGQSRLPRQAGGLIVDYLGLADQLKNALAAYTQGGGRGKPKLNQEEAVAVMLEKCEILETSSTASTTQLLGRLRGPAGHRC